MQNFNFSETLIKLNNPLITLEEKHFFLKRYVSPHTILLFDGKTNSIKIDIDNKKSITLQDKLMNRVGDYLKNGIISLGSIKLDGISKKEALNMLKNIIDRINIQFDMYVRSNQNIMNRVGKDFIDGQLEFDNLFTEKKENFNSYIEYVDDNYGLNKSWQSHPYQEEFKKLLRKSLLWCNAYATGLGKTSTALLVIQDQHNLNLKNKTLFTVPKSTLSNWYKEMFIGDYRKGVMIKPPVYDEKIEDECLFIGLIDSRTYKSINILNENDLILKSIKSSGKHNYLLLSIDEQLKLIKDNKYKKIFISHENFYRLRLKEDTVENYISYSKLVDADFAQAEYAENNKAYQNKIKQYYDVLNKESKGKNKTNIFLEDLGIDSLVIDEAHIFKNAKDMNFTSGFRQVKFLSSPQISDRGIDLLAKSHYIKKNNSSGDGILALTATPLTNSPVEIYSILSIVMGEYFINKILSINGINDFIKLFCKVENEEDYTVDGEIKNFNVFKGLHNLKYLREVLYRCLYFLTVDDKRVQEYLKLPSSVDKLNSIEMSKYQNKKINEYKMSFNKAKEAKQILNNDGKPFFDDFISQNYSYFESLIDKYHEDVLLISSPFNFIRKMEALILDEDLDEKATIFFINKKYKKELEKAVSKFNSKKFKQRRKRLNPHTSKENVFNIITTYDEDLDKEYIEYEFYSSANIIDLDKESNNLYGDLIHYSILNNKNNNNQIDFENDLLIILDTLDFHEQTYFFDLLVQEFSHSNKYNEYKNDIPSMVSKLLKFNVSNKVFSFLQNIIMENNNPRGKLHNDEDTKLVKQVLFCDYLGIHFKLKHLIHQLTNIPLNKIEIVTGQHNYKNEEIQEIQDGFNAEEEENKYQIVICNKKAEYGINLQNGTQAIHHLTIGWTSDSKTQRDGRAIRQGNKTDFLNNYTYDMINTFDTYKRNLVNRKNNWINQIIDFYGSDYVDIINLLSHEEQEKMIALIGDEDEVKNNLIELEKHLQEEKILKEKINIKNKQRIYLDFLINSNSFTSNNKDSYNIFYLNELLDVIEIKSKTIDSILNIYQTYKNSLSMLNLNLIKVDFEDVFEKNKDIISGLNKHLSHYNLINLDKGVTLDILNELQLEIEIKNLINKDNINILKEYNKLTSDFISKVKRDIKSYILINSHLNYLLNERFIHFDLDAYKYLKGLSYLSQGFCKWLKHIDKKSYLLLKNCFYFDEKHEIIHFHNENYFDNFNQMNNDEKKLLNNIIFYYLHIYIINSYSRKYITIDLLNDCLTSNSSFLKTEIDNMSRLEKDISDMAISGFNNLSKSSKYCYYPDDIVNYKNNIYSYDNIIFYPESILFSIRNQIDVEHNVIPYSKKGLDNVFMQIESILSDEKYPNNQILHKANQIHNLINKLGIHIFVFSKNINEIKHYPINNPYFNIYTTKNNLQPHKLFHSMKLCNDNKWEDKDEREIITGEIHSWLKDCSHTNIEIFKNNRFYNIFMEVIALLELFYLNKIDFNYPENILASKDVFTKDDIFYNFNYNWFECYKNKDKTLIHDFYTTKNHKNDNVYKLSQNIIQQVLDFEFEKINVEEEITNKNVDILKVNDLLKQHKLLESFYFIVGNRKINLNDDNFIVLNHVNSYYMYSKYKYRDIAERFGSSIYFFTKKNNGISYENERKAYHALMHHYGLKQNVPFNNVWIMDVKTLKLLLLYIYNNADSSEIKFLSVKTISDNDVIYRE